MTTEVKVNNQPGSSATDKESEDCKINSLRVFWSSLIWWFPKPKKITIYLTLFWYRKQKLKCKAIGFLLSSHIIVIEPFQISSQITLPLTDLTASGVNCVER